MDEQLERDLSEFVELEVEKHTLEEQLKKVTKRITELDDTIREQLTHTNLATPFPFKHPKTGKPRTIYIRRDTVVWPVEDRVEVVGALKAADLAQYVREDYNDSSLRSYVRGYVDELENDAIETGAVVSEDAVRAALPKPLADALQVAFKYKLQSRKT